MRLFPIAFHVAAFLGLVAMSFGCISLDDEDGQEQSLDVAIKPTSNATQLGQVKKEIAANGPMNHVIDWQRFFRPPPNPAEFAGLKRKLIHWPEPKSLQGLLEQARAYGVTGDLKSSEAVYRQAIRRYSESITAHTEIAQTYLKMNNLDRCFSYLKRAKEILDEQEFNDRGELFHYRYTLALAYIKQRNEDAGHAILSELVALDKTFMPAYAALASSYFSNDKVEVAEFIAKRGIDRGKEVPSLVNLLGVIELKRGRYVEAKRWFDRALELQPYFGPALVNRANLHMFRGQLEAARGDLGLALSINPIHAEAYIVRGILEKRQGFFRRSEASFKRAIDIDPENGYARYNLAVLKAEELKDSGEALRLFNEVLQVQKAEDNLKELAKLNIESLQQNRLEFRN